MLVPIPQQETVVFTVSELNTRIKGLLESNYRFVWVKGEISNFRIPASGHYYFTLKDQQSQIRGVFFRTQHRHLQFVPEDGLQVICQGRISVYEPRGEYQLIVEIMEPQGRGALQLAFEQLKKRLEAEGLFDPAGKPPLPLCPQSIAIVTSPTGAAIRDMIKIFQNSPYPLSITLLPVRVQGEEAGREIAAAIETANALLPQFQWEVMIVGRGGGSIEDLWPFNEEVVARAVASSKIPVISAVGHEIDFTISDLVATLRAPTPTAAAQWVVSHLENLQRELTKHRDRMIETILHMINVQKQHLHFLDKRLVDPKRRLQDLRLLVDDRMERLQLAFVRRLQQLQMHHSHLSKRLLLVEPGKNVKQYQSTLNQLYRELTHRYRRLLENLRFQLQEYASNLDTLSPLAVLARGYSVSFRLPDRMIIRTAADVRPGEEVEIQLSQGSLECTVNKSVEDVEALSSSRVERKAQDV
jgi:exodeoxyribonuclease VII large subunit